MKIKIILAGATGWAGSAIVKAIHQLEIPVAATKGLKEVRGGELNGTQIHAVRLPGFVLGVDVIFGLPDEKLIIKHEAGSSAAPYVGGTLLAAKNVAKLTGLVRGLEQILEE